jgi:hypothetical protein
MKYKNGVYTEVTLIEDGKQNHLKTSPEIQHAMHVADALSKAVSGKEILITALFDGTHKKGSKHYEGNAFDIRKWHYNNDQLHSLLINLKENLGPDYDIIEEKTHIHIEYDPK